MQVHKEERQGRGTAGSPTPTSWRSGNLPGSHYLHVSLARLCTVKKHCKGSQLIETAGLAEQNPGKEFLPVVLNWRPVALTEPAYLHIPVFWRCSPGCWSWLEGPCCPAKLRIHSTTQPQGADSFPPISAHQINQNRGRH